MFCDSVELSLELLKASSVVNIPAMQAVIKHTRAPPTNALNTSLLTFSFFSGTKADIVETSIPMEPGLENPQIA